MGLQFMLGTRLYIINKVVEDLKNRGAIFIEELVEIKDSTRPVIFSAHGVPKSVPAEAINKILTCRMPLAFSVKKYIESQTTYKKGFDIILIGHNFITQRWLEQWVSFRMDQLNG